MSGQALPEIPHDDADFTPDLARKIIAQYQHLIRKKDQEISLLNSQFRNCHIEIGKLRDALLTAPPLVDWTLKHD